MIVDDLLGQDQIEFGGDFRKAGRSRLSIRPMARLLCMKRAFNLGVEELAP